MSADFEAWWAAAQRKNALFGTDKGVGRFIWRSAVREALAAREPIGYVDKDHPSGIDFVPGALEALPDLAPVYAAPHPSPAGLTEAVLNISPRLRNCDTPEPNLTTLVYRYYRMYFDQPKADELAEQYIAALSKQEGSAK